MTKKVEGKETLKMASCKRITKDEMANTFLFEAAWEVCNQVGGIYTVIQSKVPMIINKWGSENYCLLGPYFHHQAVTAFEPIDDLSDPVAQAVQIMKENGFSVYYGYWLVAGRPRVVLFDPFGVYDKLGNIKYELWEHHKIPTPGNDELINQVLAYGYQVKVFLKIVSGIINGSKEIIAHFHEWMAGTPIPDLRRERVPVKIVFTTHATTLGRYLAMNDPNFYDHITTYDWAKETKYFNVETVVGIERAATHGSHIFSTVSEITGAECRQFLSREPDVILPNGLNIERFEALHEFQNLHRVYKDKINEFTMGHFFKNYSFDLDKTLYFFTSGRFEYQNKGYDLTLEALARLNHKMKQAKLDTTVVMFFITRQPYYSINSDVLHSQALLEEIQRNCDEIQNQVAKKFFYEVASEKSGFVMPNLNEMVDDYMKLRLRKNVQSWRTHSLPSVVTHNLVNEHKDPIVNFLRTSGLINKPDDKVKVVYHPDFISPSNPLFRMEYYQFIRGCHMGVFPSYYEPWGYTPLECIASGIPTVTCDLAGFGNYVENAIPDHDKSGIYVLIRKHKSFNDAAEELANTMFNYAKLNRRDRITQRNKTEASSVLFDWQKLGKHYDIAYKMALAAID